MRVLFALRSAGFSRFFETVFRDLRADGHDVEVVCQLFNQRNPEPNAPEIWLARQAELNGFSCGLALSRRDRWRRYLSASRDVMNYVSYLRPGRQASRMILTRHEESLPRVARNLVRYPIVRGLMLLPGLRQTLRWFERLAPPDPAIVHWLQNNRPDIVVASPVLMAATDEVEYIKAAAALGITTMVAVMSWDNLTTKGVFQIIPDMTLVWNQIQVEEAVRLHNVPREKVAFTGAPVFDAWFGMQPTMDRASFCRQAGLDPEKLFVLYLCSSWSIAQDETKYVEEVVNGLRQHPDTRRLNVLVRPHPSNAEIWEHYTENTVTVWPREGAVPGTPEFRQGLFHAIHFSEGVVGINTSGFIEAAIVDKPCITILAERYRDTQREMAHFQYLLNGNFLEVASNLPQAAEKLSAILRGEDAKRECRRQFVGEFVRPWGSERPASRIMARAIEAVAAWSTIDQLHSVLAANFDARDVPPSKAALVAAQSKPAALAVTGKIR